MDIPTIARAGALLLLPTGERTLPQQHAVGGIASDQLAVGWQLAVDTGRSLIEDREDPPACRDDRAHAAGDFVAAAPARPSDPTQVARRADFGIVGDRVAGGVVQKVRPLVDLRGPGLDRLPPASRRLDVRHALWREHPRHLLVWHVGNIVDDEQVDQVVDKRQRPTVILLNRNTAVLVLVAQCHSRFVDHIGIRIETENQIARVGA
jgi:hypothetical protein